jgi:hypothetical protein
VELDLRVGWSATDWMDVSLAGRNLLHDHHTEFREFLTYASNDVERSYYLNVTHRF